MPTESAAGAAIWAKWGHVFAGALGIAVTLAWAQTMSTRQMVLATSSGLATSLWGTPIAVAVARTYLPATIGLDVMDGLTGLIGFVGGMVGIFLAGGVMRMAESFSKDPWAIFDRLRGKKEGN